MLRIAIIISVFLLIIGTAAAQKMPLPEFKDYPVQEKFYGKSAKPKLTSKRARLFRTNIRMQAAEGSDFAGHYRIAIWGCGSGCAQFAIVDVKTGDVYFPPEAETVMILPEQEDEPLQYQVGSKLLIVVGHKTAPDWQKPEEGRFFYEWKNHRLALIRKVKSQRKQD